MADRLIDRLFPPDERTLFVHLTRHFFKRLFDIETISDEAGTHLDIVPILSILAVLGPFYAFFRFIIYYTFHWHFSPAAYASLTLTDQCVYVSFSMAVIGVVAVLEWDQLFPDGRDYVNLMPLPLRIRTLFCAKITALVQFVGLFILAVAAASAVIYPLVSSQSIVPSPDLHHVLRMMAAHAVSVVSGCLFMILFFVALQGILINLLSYRLFRRVTLFVQGLATVALVCVIFLLPLTPSLLRDWEKTHSPLLYAFPPIWYLALYRTLLGTHNAIFLSLARISILAFVLSAVIAGVTYLACYRRFSQRAFETADDQAPSRFGMAALLTRLLDRLWVKEGPERGAFYFVLKTLARSRKQRLCFTAYTAVGLAIVATTIVAIVYRSVHENLWAVLRQPSQALISIPMVIGLFALLGLRAAFRLPAELPANWIFKMTEENCGRDCLAGARKAMVVLVVVPLFAVSFVVYAELWGSLPSAMLALTGILLSLILVEPLLYSERQIPFTCAHKAGKSRIPLAGSDSWLVLALYVYAMALFRPRIFHERILWAVALVAEAVALNRLIARRNRSFTDGLGVDFEDRPPPVIQSLDLKA